MNYFIPDMFEKTVYIMRYYMEHMPRRFKDTEPQASTDPTQLSRRKFLAAAAVAAAGLATGCSPSTSRDSKVERQPTEAKPPVTSQPEEVDRVMPPDTTTTPDIPETTAPVATPSTEVIVEPKPFIDPELLVPGQKVYDQVVIQPDGTVVMNLPVFADFMTDGDFSETLLNTRGIIMEVVRNDINPEVMSSDGLIRSQEALPGEAGRVQSFAHNQTEVDVDRNGDGLGDDGVKEPMYRDLELIQTGAIIELQHPDGRTMRYRAIDGNTAEGLAYRIVQGVRYTDASGQRKTNFEKAQLYRNQDTGGKRLYTLVACWPDGSSDDRIVVEAVLIED
jgi:hypothetical protein